LELLFGFIIALLLYNSQIISNFFKTLFLLPMAITPAVIGILWRLMYDADYGIINYLLSLVGFPQIPWLVHPQIALLALIIVDVWEWTPFIILIIYAGMESIPVYIYEAAVIDGVGGLRKIFSLTVPILAPLISIGVFLRAIDAYKMFEIAYITTSGGPGVATENASLFAYRQGFTFFHTGYASSCAIIMLIIIILVDVLRGKITSRNI
jgi:multiple sugar transport system permease protein